jgi:ubiquinone/menaquinone biosynthesis C-methylase UbiE
MTSEWQWDETLFRGSAPYYVRGRLPYAPNLADRLTEILSLDGHGRLLDVGCGPGLLTLLLARSFDEAIGVDPDPGMLAEAERRANEAGITNIRWLKARAEELPGDLGTFRVATFGRSFHWMDRPRVAAIIRETLEPGGAFVQVATMPEEHSESVTDPPYPVPPQQAIGELVRRYIGPDRRAGQGVRERSPDDEVDVLARAGFEDYEEIFLPIEGALVRTEDDIVALVFSRSGSAPHLFGERLGEFEADLRKLLHAASPSGMFAEQPHETQVRIWRKPQREVAVR